MPKASNFARGCVAILYAVATGGSGSLASSERRALPPAGRPRAGRDEASDDVDADLASSFGFFAGLSTPRDDRLRLIVFDSFFSSCLSSSPAELDSTAKNCRLQPNIYASLTLTQLLHWLSDRLLGTHL